MRTLALRPALKRTRTPPHSDDAQRSEYTAQRRIPGPRVVSSLTVGFYRDRSPTPMMEKSLLYKLVLNGQRGVAVNSSYFEHAYSSKHGKARNSLVLESEPISS